MKIGFFCESPIDRAGLAVFTEGILGEPPEPINLDLELHGVTTILNAPDGIIKGIHWRSDAEALVIAVDSDDSGVHDPKHDVPGADVGRCRFCKVREIVSRVRKQLKPRPRGLPELKFAIGLAVPAIEAWYLVGKEHQIGEAACLAMGRSPITRPQLKRMVYGSDRSPQEHSTECATREARRVIEKHLTEIEAAFPMGFGLMAQEIRSWKVHQA